MAKREGVFLLAFELCLGHLENKVIKGERVLQILGAACTRASGTMDKCTVTDFPIQGGTEGDRELLLIVCLEEERLGLPSMSPARPILHPSTPPLAV